MHNCSVWPLTFTEKRWWWSLLFYQTRLNSCQTSTCQIRGFKIWAMCPHYLWHYVDGLVQERHTSTANALELCLSCTNPSTYPLWCHIAPEIFIVWSPSSIEFWHFQNFFHPKRGKYWVPTSVVQKYNSYWWLRKSPKCQHLLFLKKKFAYQAVSLQWISSRQVQGLCIYTAHYQSPAY